MGMGEDCHEGGRGVCEQVNFSDLPCVINLASGLKSLWSRITKIIIPTFSINE